MLRFLGQGKYSARELIGYELFLRESVEGQWQFPKDFGKFAPEDVASLLVSTIKSLPNTIQLVSLNLDQPQFIDPRYSIELGAAQRICPDTQIIVELTEHEYGISAEQLHNAASLFQEQRLWVCLDDVGTGANSVALAEHMSDVVLEYKFALQNFRGKRDFVTSVSPQLQFWWEQAHVSNTFLVIEGFEEQSDLKVATNYPADIVQGYYFERPHLTKLK
ncbi:EAL domain-containing protein [Paucilactobacillus suebicus]|uniref:C-di-GMP-specific phosphodiesterase n=1 Tax=Paucilactobacillus suebicus DSM 5007 = KCTC 3549 TaxID=1423807 RepID=A0A0R1VYQ6_9LACO|nr:EAL domain-containing protein [Paucilactobacillus suebicus]KRM10501.1 C-di-GMP-specific phosphodiesterase [Paucilactobacillus suebicus DSM 5007 = KCTC 3549]